MNLEAKNFLKDFLASDYNYSKLKYLQDKANSYYNDKNYQLNMETLLENYLGFPVQKEVFVDFNFVDVYFELDTPRFAEIFGADKILPQNKDEKVQKVIIENQGKTHFCKTTGELNVSTLSKLRLLRKLGYNVSYSTTGELRKIAEGGKPTLIPRAIEMLKLNMNNF